MTYSKRPQVGFELEFGPPVHRVAPHEQAVSCSFFYLCLLCFLMFLLACLFFVSTSSCCLLFPFFFFSFLLIKPCFDWCNRKRGSILKRSLKYKHFNRSYCGSSFKRDTSRKANYHQPSDQKSASYRSVVLVSSVSGGTSLCLKHQRH